MNDKIKEIKSIVADICMTTGANTAHDYDGIETLDDVILYLKSLHRKLPSKSIGQSYVVKPNRTFKIVSKHPDTDLQKKKRVYTSEADFFRYKDDLIKRYRHTMAVEVYELINGEWEMLYRKEKSEIIPGSWEEKFRKENL